MRVSETCAHGAEQRLLGDLTEEHVLSFGWHHCTVPQHGPIPLTRTSRVILALDALPSCFPRPHLPATPHALRSYHTAHTAHRAPRTAHHTHLPLLPLPLLLRHHA